MSATKHWCPWCNYLILFVCLFVCGWLIELVLARCAWWNYRFFYVCACLDWNNFCRVIHPTWAILQSDRQNGFVVSWAQPMCLLPRFTFAHLAILIARSHRKVKCVLATLGAQTFQCWLCQVGLAQCVCDNLEDFGLLLPKALLIIGISCHSENEFVT